jgi:hypothetical protein
VCDENQIWGTFDLVEGEGSYECYTYKKTQQQKRKVWVSFLINILAVCFKDGMLMCTENCIWGPYWQVPKYQVGAAHSCWEKGESE